MKVQELIKMLEQLDQDEEIIIHEFGEGDYEIIVRKGYGVNNCSYIEKGEEIY